MYAVVTFALWCFVFFKTTALVRHGYIFEAPCLEGINLGATDGMELSSGRSSPMNGLGNIQIPRVGGKQ
jgi:hypothetical protein